MNELISLIVYTYNQEENLPIFINCINKQSLNAFKIIAINDASTDNTKNILNKWASQDHRVNIIDLHSHIGIDKAHSNAINLVTTDTICFAEPQDTLPPSSLESRYIAYKEHGITVRACYEETTTSGKILNHEIPPQNLPPICTPKLAANLIGAKTLIRTLSTWLFPTTLLQQESNFNNNKTKSSISASLLIRLFYHISKIAWIPDIACISTIDPINTSPTNINDPKFHNNIENLHLFYQESLKSNNTHIADTYINAEIDEHIKQALPHLGHSSTDDKAIKQLFLKYAEICNQYNTFNRSLNKKNIQYTNLSIVFLKNFVHALSTSPSFLQAFINAYKIYSDDFYRLKLSRIHTLGWLNEVIFHKLDAEQNIFRISYYFSDRLPVEEFFWNDKQISFAYTKNRKVTASNNVTIYERIIWAPIPTNERTTISLIIGGKTTALNHTCLQIHKNFNQPDIDDANFPKDIRALRHLAKQQLLQHSFLNSWMFIDKDTEADDNAEHLYRWLMHNHPEINAWFVLNEDSHDWNRLIKDGFKLVPHGSPKHYALFLLCKKLISSQMDRYIFEPLEMKYFLDFPQHKFICLPHGVTKDDVSNWFNSIPFDLFITATLDEKNSISGDGTPYEMTNKEVRLGGFPRYDKWLESTTQENIVFVMPTWRADLVGEWDGKGQRRTLNPKFFSSKFVRMWQDVFADQRFASLLSRYNYRVVFFAHPCFEDYLKDMPFPGYVEKRSKKDGSIINIMQKSKIMITDFSSVAYDMAYMRRPVVYYQYEDKSEFTKSQRWVNGYIDYERMGFGPVCRNKTTLIHALEEAFKFNGVMPEPYRSRAENTFVFHDANCCKRAYEFIIQDSLPYNTKQRDE